MLRDEIAKLIYGDHHPNDITWKLNLPIADKLLALLAPELEKAKKWDRVKEIAREYSSERVIDYVYNGSEPKE